MGTGSPERGQGPSFHSQGPLDSDPKAKAACLESTAHSANLAHKG